MTQKNSIETLDATPKPKMLLGVEWIYLCLIGIFFAFVGFFAENAAKGMLEGIIDARFHRLPFISPYGLIAFAFHLLLGTPRRIAFFGKPLFASLTEKKRRIYSELTAYFAICLTVFLGELAIGNLWGEVFGVDLWNYSNLPLHVTQYTCAYAVFGYGTGAYLIFRFLYAPLLSWLRAHVPYQVAKRIVCTLGVLIVLDTLCLMGEIMIRGEASMLWQIQF